jgi:O-antigen/teichoic acid export membrane protein
VVRRFFRDSLVYAIPGAVSTGTSIVTFPLFAHHFQPGAYGVLDLISFTGTLAVMIVALEIYQGVGRYTAGEKDHALVHSYASTALWWTVACYGGFAAIGLLLADPISELLLQSHSYAPIVRVATLWTAVQGVLSVMQAQLRWQLRPRAFGLAAVVNALVTAAGSLAFVFLAHLGVEGVMWGQLLGASVALLLVAYFSRDIFGLSFDRPLLRKMLVYSTPLVISNVGVFLNLYADRFVIQHERSLGDVGLYGVGNRVALLVMLVLMGFQGAAAPLFLARRDDPSTPGQIAQIFRAFTVLSLAALLALSVLAPPMLRILAAAPYQGADRVVPFLVVSTVFANMFMFAPGLAIAERTRSMAKYTAAAGVANLLLALVLVPPLGITGAGLATSMTSVAWFVVLMRASQVYYPVPHRWRPVLEGFAFAAVVVVVAAVVLPSSRSAALEPGYLIIRVVLVVVGVVGCSVLTLQRDELGQILTTVRGVVSRGRPRVPSGVPVGTDGPRDDAPGGYRAIPDEPEQDDLQRGRGDHQPSGTP